MNKTTIYLVLMSAVLLLAQAVVFNNLVLFGYAVPFVFIYIILSLPITLSTNISVTAGFVIGLIADAFSDTYGMNAVSCTILAFVRKPVFHLYMQRDEDLGGQSPSMRSMGVPVYLKFAGTMVLIYCTLACTIEAFGLFHPWRLLLRVIASSVYTLLIVYAIDSLSLSSHEKRL